MALKSQYDDLHIMRVKVTENILDNQKEFVDLPKQYVKDMNLTDIFGVMFKTDSTKFGELKKEIYDEGYRIRLENTIIEPKNYVGEIKGPIKSVRIVCWPNKTMQLSLNYENNHSHFGDFTFFIEQKQITNISIYQRDQTKITPSMKDYEFNKEENAFERISKKESQEYINLANYFLILMKDKETKELWEQTKKQREINKQDSLKVNFKRD